MSVLLRSLSFLETRSWLSFFSRERALEEAEEEYDSSLYVAGEEAFDDNSEDIYDILITSQVGNFPTLVIATIWILWMCKCVMIKC